MVYIADAGNPAGNELVKMILEMRQPGSNKRMSKYRLALDLKVSDTCVHEWVKGRKSPNQENFNRLQEYHRMLDRHNRIQNPFGR